MLRKILFISTLFILVFGSADRPAAIRAALHEAQAATLYLPVVQSDYCPPLFFDHFEDLSHSWSVVDDPTRTMEIVAGFAQYDHPIVDNELWDVLAVDISGDRLDDLITASSGHPGLNYWENLGGGNFEEHRQTGTWRFVTSLTGVDLDRDDDLDLVTGDLVQWWENTGGDLLLEHVIDLDTGPGIEDQAAADLDGDGDLDVLAAARSLGVVWWESDGTPADGGWERHSIAADFESPYAIATADFDNDGDPDVLSVSPIGHDVAWWENDGDPGDGGWVFHPILTDGGYNFLTLVAVDMDGDGDPDVVGAGAQPVVWWENEGVFTQDWSMHPIHDNFPTTFDLAAADLDRDGDMDVAATSYDSYFRKATWFENDGAQGFTTRILSDQMDHSRAITVGDIDGDRRPDLWATDQAPNQVIRWMNRSKEYRILVKPEGAVSAAAAPIQAVDFSASVRVRNQHARAGTYGLVFGLAGDWEQFYSFEVDAVQNYWLWIYSNTAGWSLLRQGSASALNSGSVENLLKVERAGEEIRVYANGQLLDSIQDATYSGLRGLGLIASSTTEENLDVRFDQFEVRTSGCR